MSRLRRVFHLGLWGPRVEEGVDWEIEHHINERIDELIAAGASRAAAEAEARRAFGNVGRIRHELNTIDRDLERRMKLGVWLETVRQDVHYGLRGMVRNPSFALALILTLGLGIGANVAMFSVLDALLLRRLPYPAPEELVVPWTTDDKGEIERPYFSWKATTQLFERQQVAEHMFGYSSTTGLYVGGVEPISLSMRTVTHEFEETLAVQPLIGRGFSRDDARVGATPVAMVSYDFWRSALGSDPGVLNTLLELEGKRYQVIGVMPKDFKFPTYSTSEVWVPILDDGTAAGEKVGQLEIVARVPAGRLAAAQSQFNALATAVSKELSPNNVGGARFEPLDRDRVQRSIKQALIVLVGAVVLILMVAGVNMINLLLMRGTVRVREIAVRLAIGASRARLVRQLVTEALTLSLMSGLVATLIAYGVLRGVRAIMPKSITFWAPYAIAIETRALLFTFMLTVLCGLAFGLLPAYLSTRVRRSAGANVDLTRYAARTVARSRLRRSLVVIELALSVTLLAGAGLLMRSFVKLVSVDPGFQPDNLAMMHIEVSSARHPNGTARAEYLGRLEARIEAIPGVRAVTMSQGMPPRTNISFGDGLQAEGAAAIPGFSVIPNANVRPDFIEIVGATLLAGRGFTDRDDKTSVIVDEDLAARLWPGQNPVGRRFRIDDDWDWVTVIGVMKDFKMMGPDTRETDYAMLYPVDRERGLGGYMALAIRTDRDPDQLLPAIRRAVREVDARQPIADLMSANKAYASAIEMPRFLLVLISILAIVALALASVGVYGVLAYGVSQRTHEIGVRIALGARMTQLQSMVVREGMLLALVGVGLGIAGALALSRFIRAVLFMVEPNDPLTLVGVMGALLIAALIASALPARRATKVNPLSAIRAE